MQGDGTASPPVVAAVTLTLNSAGGFAIQTQGQADGNQIIAAGMLAMALGLITKPQTEAAKIIPIHGALPTNGN